MSDNLKTHIPSGSSVQQMGIDDLPQGAVLLSKEEVKTLMWDKIQAWKPHSEIWAFKHGPASLAFSSALTGILTHTWVRKAFGLRHHGRVASYMAVVPIPAILSMTINYAAVTQHILVSNYKCPSCLEIRSACIQSLTGMAQPVILSLFTAAVMAKTAHTAVVPRITQPLLLKDLFVSVLKPHYGPLTALLVLNLSVALCVTNYQIKQINLVHKKLSNQSMNIVHY